MNKVLALVFAVLLCASVAMAGYGYPRSYYTSHKTHLGGAGYGYHGLKYAPRIAYRKPIIHHAPVVYAHKSYSKPHVTHYVKPSYHHEAPHHAPVYHSKPAYYLGGHASHGLAYKPAVYGHGLSYGYKGRYHH